MDIGEKFNRFDCLDDDIEALNRNGEYSNIINEVEPCDEDYDDDANELAECGNYSLEEDVLEEGSRFPKMNINQS